MKTDTDNWITLWNSVSTFTFQHFCYQKIQAQNLSIFGWKEVPRRMGMAEWKERGPGTMAASESWPSL